MPELPEVETIARGLDRRVRGDQIESVWIGPRTQPLKSPAELIAATLEQRKIASVRRMGKHIVFDLDSIAGEGARATHSGTAQWIVHLGMTGKMLVCEPSAEPAKHTHAVLTLASGRELRFIDPRMFGKLRVLPEAGFAPEGIEPLEIGPEEFIQLFRRRKTPIKSALLNQKLLRGVGNIYADESLARAGIRPRRQAGTLTREELRKLYMALKKVLRQAIELGGSSVSDYVDANGEEGFFQVRHWVYSREGLPCRKCKTPIKRIVIAGRSSHYCQKCQK